MAKGFTTTKINPIVPVQRAAKQDILPYAVRPAAQAIPWQDVQPVFFNRWTDTFVSSVSTPHDGSVPTPSFTIGDADVSLTLLKLDRLVFLRLYIQIGAGTKINTLVRDDGASTLSGDAGKTFLRLPYHVADGNTRQFSIYNYTFTQGPVADNQHGNQSAYFVVPKLAPGTNELPISVWDGLAGSAANPGDAIDPDIQVYWSAGDIYDLQLEFETDDTP